jgi:peptidoglycan-associated lipoprotein
MLALVLFLAGCPKRPLMPPPVAPAPVAAPAPPPAAPTPAPAPAPAPAPMPVAPVAPAPTPAPPKEYAANDNLKPINFDFDKSVIRPGDAKTLDASADWLRRNPNNLLLIEGHCDERGTAEYNLALGERRAKAALDYLVSKGVSTDRITIVSFGKERPLCSESSEACHARNRRDQFLTKER